MTKIYTSKGCAPCRALKEKLELLGITPEYVLVDDLPREDYPVGLRAVPTLITDDGTMIVGNDIETYLLNNKELK
jgi:glutaredoxin